MKAASFIIHGHPNVRATHRTTLEFTKDADLSTRGDCILGVGATFEASHLLSFLACPRVAITITAGNASQTILATPNPSFSDERELVIRLGVHTSERTFATDADIAAAHLDRALVAALQNPHTVATVEVRCANGR